MDEIIAEVGLEHSVELIRHHSAKRSSLGRMAPQDAAYLARGILSCADALCGVTPPQAGTIIADAHLVVSSWKVTRSDDELLLTLTVQSGIDLTFQIAHHAAKEIAAA
jgi:hypothetical protein